MPVKHRRSLRREKFRARKVDVRRRQLRFENLEARQLLAADLLIDPPVADVHAAIDSAEGESGNTISDSGGFEGSQQTLDLGANGGVTLDYQYEHFFIPDNFIIRYEGRNLFQTGFVGGSRSGTIQVPQGNSDTVEIIVATNDQGTAWNYTVTANTCGDSTPFNISLASGEFMQEMDGDGNTVCKGTGTVFVGRTDGIAQMLRIENATAEYNNEKLTVSGTVFSEIGTGQILTKPIFTGSFEIPFKTGTDPGISDAMTNGSGEFQLGGMDVDFTSLSINRNSVALGAKFELLEDLGTPDFIFSGSDGLIITQSDVNFGASVKFSAPNFKNFNLFGLVPIKEFSNFSIEYIAPEDAVKIQGKLSVDVLSKAPRAGTITADLSGPNFVQIKGGEVDLKGRLSIETDFKFPPKGWGLREVFFTVDTIGRDVGGGAKLTLPFGRTIKAEGQLGFKLPIPPLELNLLSLSVDNLNVPIPAYPLVFFQGFRGAAENFAESDPDPVEFRGGISATLGPQILGISAIRWDGDVTMSSEQASGMSTVTIINDKLFKQTGTATLNWDKKFFKSSGVVNILDGLIQTNDSFTATSNFDVKMGGGAMVGIPKSVPLIGGAQIAGGQYILDFSNNGDLSDDFAAGWGNISIQKLGVEINFVAGVKAFFDGRIERIGAKNIPPTGSFEIAPGTEWVVLGADWETEVTTDVPLEVILPDGTVVQEADFAANNIAIIDEFTDETTKAVVVINPTPGIWDIRVKDPTGLGNVEYTAAENAAAPTIDVTAPATDVGGGVVTIGYDAFDVDSDAEVSLFYDDDNTGFDGVLIADGMVEMDGPGTFQWNTQGVATGDYYVYAQISDGDNPPSYSYSDGMVQVREEADLLVTQMVAPDPIFTSDTVTYTVDTENLGTSTATNVTATATLPENATFQSSTLTPTSINGNELTFDLGDLNSGETTSFDIVVVAPDAAEILENSVFVQSDVFDPDASNDVSNTFDVVQTPQPLLPDLQVTLLTAPTSIDLGESFFYELQITNDGPGVANNVELVEFLPSSSTYQTSSTTQGTTSFNGSSVTASIGQLGPGESATVRIDLGTVSAGDLVSTTTVSSDETDEFVLDNALITVNTVNSTEPAAADLSLTADVDNPTPAVGDEINITLTLANEGPGVASAIMISAPLPAQLEFISSSGVQGAYDSSTGIWNVGNLRDNLSRSLTIRAKVVSGGQSTMTAEIIGVSENDPDSTPNNNEEGEDDQTTLMLTSGPNVHINSVDRVCAARGHEALLLADVNGDVNRMHVLDVDWGDGEQETIELEQLGAVELRHQYRPGDYTIEVKVTDDQGEMNSQTFEYTAHRDVTVIDRTLHLFGGNSVDVVTMVPILSNLWVSSLLNGRWDGRFISSNDVDQIEAHLCGGSDIFQALPGVSMPMHVNGGAGGDLIWTGGGADIVHGEDGVDRIFTYGGNDHVDGGNHRDYIYLGSGDDSANGGEGGDVIFGQHGIDQIMGGPGNDSVFGGSDDDLLWLGPGSDLGFGQGGDDEINGDEGSDILRGGIGNDFLRGGLDVDTLFGQLGDDTLVDDGEDALFPGPGDDMIVTDNGVEPEPEGAEVPEGEFTFTNLERPADINRDQSVDLADVRDAFSTLMTVGTLDLTIDGIQNNENLPDNFQTLDADRNGSFSVGDLRVVFTEVMHQLNGAAAEGEGEQVSTPSAAPQADEAPTRDEPSSESTGPSASVPTSDSQSDTPVTPAEDAERQDDESVAVTEQSESDELEIGALGE